MVPQISPSEAQTLLGYMDRIAFRPEETAEADRIRRALRQIVESLDLTAELDRLTLEKQAALAEASRLDEEIIQTAQRLTEQQETRRPVAEAGRDQVVRVGDMVRLDGTASTPGAGGRMDFAWRQVAGFLVDFDDPTSPTPSFPTPHLDRTEVLSFDLVVTDTEVASSPDRVNVTVQVEGTSTGTGAEEVKTAP